jgi:hypothetical protein
MYEIEKLSFTVRPSGYRELSILQCLEKSVGVTRNRDFVNPKSDYAFAVEGRVRKKIHRDEQNIGMCPHPAASFHFRSPSFGEGEGAHYISGTFIRLYPAVCCPSSCGSIVRAKTRLSRRRGKKRAIWRGESDRERQ